MILHMVTFITLALGSIYELRWLIFVSLITLLLGLFFGKETLERLDYEEFEKNLTEFQHALEEAYGETETGQRTSHRADIIHNKS